MKDKKGYILTDSYGDQIEVFPVLNIYQGNNLCVRLMNYDPDLEGLDDYCSLTINGYVKFRYLEAPIDTTFNGDEKIDFLVRNGFGKPTGEFTRYGDGVYPIFLFYEEKLKEVDPRVFADYQKLQGPKKMLDDRIYRCIESPGFQSFLADLQWLKLLDGNESKLSAAIIAGGRLHELSKLTDRELRTYIDAYQSGSLVSDDLKRNQMTDGKIIFVSDGKLMCLFPDEKEPHFVKSRIQDIREKDAFLIPSGFHRDGCLIRVAGYDAHQNLDERNSPWIVYDIADDSWFEEDILNAEERFKDLFSHTSPGRPQLFDKIKDAEARKSGYVNKIDDLLDAQWLLS